MILRMIKSFFVSVHPLKDMIYKLLIEILDALCPTSSAPFISITRSIYFDLYVGGKRLRNLGDKIKI